MFDESVTVSGTTYKLLQRLGQGAFGEVFSAASEADPHHQVAIKQIYSSQEDGICTKVQREINALQQLHHPNIVALIGIDAQGPCISLVQQLALTDLQQLLAATSRPLPLPVFRALLTDLLQGLAALHGAGFMHRDIKPSNCLVSLEGRLLLSDFGQSQRMHSDQAPPPPLTGTTAAAAAQLSTHATPPRTTNAVGQPPPPAAAPEARQPPPPPPPPAAAAGGGGVVAWGPSYTTQHPSLEAFQSAAAAAAAQGGYTVGIGTRWYRAPELLYGARDYGPAVDIWGAGLVAAEMAGLIPLLPGISDIDQLARMQCALGSIQLQDWPGAAQLPDWHKISFAACDAKPWRQLLPHAPAEVLELLRALLRYDPSQRLTPAAALQHPAFQQLPAAATPEEVLQYVQHQLQQRSDRQRRLQQQQRAQQIYWQQQATLLQAAQVGSS